MDNKKFTTGYGLFSTIVVTLLGVNVFSYPRELSEIVGNDGWIPIIASGFIVWFLCYLIYKVMKNNSYKHFEEIIEATFGKILGKIVGLSFVIYSVVFSAFGLRVFGEEIKLYLLERTPIEFLFLVTILVGSYLIRAEVDNLVKFNEISFWLMFIPIGVVFIVCLYNVDFTNLLPAFDAKPIKYITSLNTSVIRYSGLSILFLILPLVKEQVNTKKAIKRGIIFTTVFYLITFVLTVATFGEKQASILLWPVVSMIGNINIPGSFIERWEGIFMSIWIIFYITTFVNQYYFASDMTKRIFNLEDIKLGSAIIIPLTYLVALYPKNVQDVSEISSLVSPILFLINIVLIPLALLIFKPRKRRGDINEKPQ
ncbi:MAG: spore gernimation protein [Clostridium lundense]|nr:spore gernimation protein [Clostridium lundense]